MTVKEVVERYYDCANRAAWDECLNLVSDDVGVDDQLAGHFVGIDVLRKAAEAMSDGKGSFLAYPERILVDGDAASVIWRYEGTNAQGAKVAYPTDANRPVIGATLFLVKNGKITYMRTIHDSVPFVSQVRR